MTSNIEIRHATNADAPAIMELIKTVYREYGFVIDTDEKEFPDLQDIAQSYERYPGAFYVACLNREIVGSVGVQLVEDGVAEIHRMYLNKELRGLQIGLKLLNTARDWAVANGVHTLQLWSDTNFTQGHAFYEKYGFTRQPQIRAIPDFNNTYEYYFTLALTL